MPYAPLARQSKPAAYNGERLLNLIAHPADVLAPIQLLGRSGLVSRVDIGAVRAMVATETYIYAVAGSKLWRSDGLTATALGDIPDDTETYIAASSLQVAVVAGGQYFCYTASLGAYSTGAIDVPKGVVYRDGYFIVWGEALGRSDGFNVSSLDDGTTFDPLDIVFAEASGDKIVAGISIVDTLWFFGASTMETFYNSGAATGPFQRNVSGAIERGCSVGKTVAKDETGAFWLGDDGRVYRTSGLQPTGISTPEVEADLDPATVTGGFIFRDRGHRFYALTRTAGTTWCFDLDTGIWCERSTGIDDDPWMANSAVFFAGNQYFGTSSGLAVAGGFDDMGEIVKAEVITPPIDKAGARFVIASMDVKMRTGSPDIGREPQVMLQVSRDGQTWGAEKWRGLGNQGNHTRQVVWRGLGQSRWFQFKLRITDPVWRDFQGATYG